MNAKPTRAARRFASKRVEKPVIGNHGIEAQAGFADRNRRRCCLGGNPGLRLEVLKDDLHRFSPHLPMG
jgi:hypothetical protein